MLTGNFTGTKCFLLDMDGTFYLDDHLLPGANKLLAFIQVNHLEYYFLTNNSSKDTEFYFNKLARLGLAVPQDRIITSGEATGIYLVKHFHDKKVFLAGTSQLHWELEKSGVKLTDSDPDLVVLGYDTGMTYQKMSILCRFILEGKNYLATHPDINCPSREGLIPDIGAMMAFVEATTGRRPDVIIGKPCQPMLSVLKEKTGFQFENMAMVGDRLYTDMALQRYGIKTILVLTGETNAIDLEKSEYQPDLVVKDLLALIDYLK